MAALMIEGYFTMRIYNAWGLLDCTPKTELYCLITVDRYELGESKTAKGTSPTWDYESTCFLKGYLKGDTKLLVTLFEHHRLVAERVIGKFEVPFKKILDGGTVAQKFPVTQTAGAGAFLCMELVYSKEMISPNVQCATYNITNVEDAPIPSAALATRASMRQLSPKTSLRDGGASTKTSGADGLATKSSIRDAGSALRDALSPRASLKDAALPRKSIRDAGSSLRSLMQKGE